MRLYRHTELPHDVVLTVPDRSYASQGPPRLFNYRPRDPNVASWLPDELLRTTVACPDEYVIRIRDVHVVHGHYLIQYPAHPLADTFNFEHSAVDRPVITAIGQQILRGEVHRHEGNALPIFHIFKDVYCNYGHMLVEVLPKLLHIRTMGITRFALLFPWSSLMFLPAVQFAANALGMTFEHVVSTTRLCGSTRCCGSARSRSMTAASRRPCASLHRCSPPRRRSRAFRAGCM